MIKKILAVVLAAVLVTLVFAACGKKPKQVDIYGYDKPVAYDENGYAVYNSQGLLRIYRTDSDGNIIKDENGEPKYDYYSVGEGFVHDGIIDTAAYAFKMPSGWEVNDNSEFVKRGTDGKCVASVMFVSDTSDEMSFTDYVDKNKLDNQETVAKFVEQGYDATMETELFELGRTQSPAYAATYMIKDSEGKLIHYAVTIYYLYQAKIYQINYLCGDGVGYDESFDFISYVKESFVTK